jgi:cytosine/uracil/thiamine/allantoin permease
LAQEEFRDLRVNDRAELARIKAEVMSSSPYNEDLAPTEPEERTWATYNIAALWIGMAIVITTYTLASGLMAAGMNWWQALFTVSLGNLILIGVLPVVPGFLLAASTPNFTGAFEDPTFIQGLYNYGLFFTFFFTGAAYLLMSLIPGRAPEPGREREAVSE